MGKTKKKTSKKKANVGKKTLKEHANIERLISKVTDADVKSFFYKIPSDKELDTCNFPNVVVNTPCLQNLATNLAEVEWGTDWLGLLLEIEEDLATDFFKLSEEDQEFYKNRMVDSMRKSKRILKWKKYQYALERKSHAEWEAEWDEEWEEDEEDEEVEEEAAEEEEAEVEAEEAVRYRKEVEMGGGVRRLAPAIGFPRFDDGDKVTEYKEQVPMY